MKKIKYKIFLIKRETFDFDVLVCLGTERKDIINFANKRFKSAFTSDDLEKLEMRGCGLTVQLYSKAFVLWLKKFPTTLKDFGYLTHEIFHTSDLMLRQAGMVLSDDSDEAWAYQIGWLTKKIYEVLNI